MSLRTEFWLKSENALGYRGSKKTPTSAYFCTRYSKISSLEKYLKKNELLLGDWKTVTKRDALAILDFEDDDFAKSVEKVQIAPVVDATGSPRAVAIQVRRQATSYEVKNGLAKPRRREIHRIEKDPVCLEHFEKNKDIYLAEARALLAQEVD